MMLGAPSKPQRPRLARELAALNVDADVSSTKGRVTRSKLTVPETSDGTVAGAPSPDLDTFPDPEDGLVWHGMRYTRIGDIVMRQTKDMNKGAEWVKEAAKRKVALWIAGLFSEADQGITVPELTRASRGVMLYHDACDIGISLSSFIHSNGMHGRGIATCMTREKVHKTAKDLFTSADFQPFRDTVHHTRLRELGDQVFGADRVASENLILTCKASERKARRSHAHQDRYHNLMTVRRGRKAWTICKLPEKVWNTLPDTSGQLLGALGGNMIDVMDEENREDTLGPSLFSTTVVMRPGDVLYNPSVGTHQCDSDEQTLASSVFYRETPEEASTSGSAIVGYAVAPGGKKRRKQ